MCWTRGAVSKWDPLDHGYEAPGGSALPCQRLLSGRTGAVRLWETAERNVERGEESTWISLLPLVGAENKTEIQLERKEHES